MNKFQLEKKVLGLEHWEKSVVHLSTEGSLWSNADSLASPLAITVFC